MKRQYSQRSISAMGLMAGLLLLVAGAAPLPARNSGSKTLTVAAAKVDRTGLASNARAKDGKNVGLAVRALSSSTTIGSSSSTTSGSSTTSSVATTLSGLSGGTALSTTRPPTTAANTAAANTVATTKAPAVTAAVPPTIATTSPPPPPPPPTTAAPPPPPPPAPAPTGSAAPSGDLPGWHQVFRDDFSTDAPVGAFASVYGSRWSWYDDGAKDTAGGNEGTPSRYYPSKVISVSGGVLNERLHTENGINMSAAILPKIGAQLYGRYSVRFRADSAAGYKTAWLLWPASQVWPRDGEIDFPEGDLNGSISAYMHRLGASRGSDQDAFETGASFNSWHTATIEWSPDRVVFVLDNNIIGTSTSRVPNTPMEWVLQTETCIGNCQPSSSTVANVQIDWVTAYTYNP